MDTPDHLPERTPPPAPALATPRRGVLLPTMRRYVRTWLTADIAAGLSAGAVVIPQAMAYATIANLPVQVGLYTCMAPMLLYALLGGSSAMSVSSTSTIATLTASTLVSAGVAASSESPSRDLVTLTLLVGVILLAARLLRLGSLVEAINKPTIIGVQVGVGATVAVGQLPKLLGETSSHAGHGFIRSLVAAARALPDLHWPTVALSVATVAVLVTLGRFAPRVPGPLVVAMAGIVVVAVPVVDTTGIALIEPVPSGLPAPTLPALGNVPALLPGALAIAVMAFLESAAVARTLRRPGDPQINSNQELLATSVASIGGSFLQAMPAAGGFSQSAVNQSAGARSQLSTLVTVALAVLVALFLGPVLSLLPEATLAAMVVVAVARLIDVRALARLARISPPDFWTAVVTTAVALTAGLLLAVAVGVVVTLALVLRALNKVRLQADQPHRDAVLITVTSAMYAANVLETQLAVLAAAEAAGAVRVAVVNLPAMRETSVTVLDSLAELDHELAQMDIELRLSGMSQETIEVAERTSWFRDLRDSGRVFGSAEDAIASRGEQERS